MKEKFRKVTAYISISIVFLSVAATVYASSYTTTFQFSVAVTWTSRYFNGSNISFSARATSTPFIHPTNNSYGVALYRDKFIDDYIWNAVLFRDSYGTAYWSNVWAWNYYVYLSKENDWVTLVSNNVTIKNY